MRAFAQTLKRAASRVDAAIIRAERESGREALDVARSLSQGTYKAATLRRMGHPYSKRNPNPPQNPAIINAQRKKFLRSWYRIAPQKEGAVIITRVKNRADYSGFLWRGTSKMIARDLPAEVLKQIAASRRRRLKDAIKSLFK